MNTKNSALDYIKYKQLNLSGHLGRMKEVRLPQKNLEWYPYSKRKKGKTSKFMDVEMNERKMNSVTGKNGKKSKIKTLGTERCGINDILFINYYY